MTLVFTLEALLKICAFGLICPKNAYLRSLFNWLVARQLGGKFVLRVEDTDQVRAGDGQRRRPRCTRATKDPVVHTGAGAAAAADCCHGSG